jgi:dihydroorotate dehydrogenase electron transfer subunit
VSDLVFDARVVAHDDIGADIWILRLETPHSFVGFAAGAFLHLQVDPGPQPLFRRAYSILSARDHEVEILYKVMGAGTRLLNRRRPGDTLSALGPLGNTFQAPKQGERAVLLAGGVGMPPILRWAENLLARGVSADRVVFAYGARNADELVLRDRVEALGVRVVYATDDGSLGHKGRITEVLRTEMEEAARARDQVRYYACGPGAMLAACSRITEQTGTPGELALETPMPCGTGVCLGCIIPCRSDATAGGENAVFKRTCIDGPIFDAGVVLWP